MACPNLLMSRQHTVSPRWYHQVKLRKSDQFKPPRILLIEGYWCLEIPPEWVGGAVASVSGDQVGLDGTKGPLQGSEPGKPDSSQVWGPPKSSTRNGDKAVRYQSEASRLPKKDPRWQTRWKLPSVVVRKRKSNVAASSDSLLKNGKL